MVASVFIGSLISSRGWSNAQSGQYLLADPHIRFTDAKRRGDAVLDLGARVVERRFRAVRDVRVAETGIETLQGFMVEAPGSGYG